MNKIEGIDSLRFFAFLNVLLFHTTKGYLIGGLGVDFFFVLSSFLLTYLTFQEIEIAGNFSRFAFFMRRALRIFPLYFLIILFSFFILPAIQKIVYQDISLPKNKLLYFFFLSNYDKEDCIFALKFLWSIAVEEQFYLFFILIAPLFKKHLFFVPGLLLIVYGFFLLFPVTEDINNYFSMLYHLPNFMVGMAGGALYHKKITGNKYWLLLSLTTLIFCFFLNHGHSFNLCISLFFLSVIYLSVNNYVVLKRFFPFSVVENLGQYTYGLYVYSGFVITVIIKIIPSIAPLFLFVTTLALLIPLSIVSFRCFERPILNLKKHFYPIRRY